MRFLTRSLLGLFLTATTFGLIAFAAGSVWNAIQARGDDDGRGFAARERVFAVNTVVTKPGVETPVLTTFGEVVSRRSLQVRAATSGTVSWVAPSVIEGGLVSAGDELIRLDPVDAKTALALADADLREAQADLRDAESALLLARDELIAAEEQAALRDRAAARQRDLLARGVGTEAAVENADLAASSARQSVLTRRQSVQSASARVELGESRIDRLEISRNDAARQLEETVVLAAFDGVLSNVAVAEGKEISSNETLIDLVDPNALEVAFRVSTAQYLRITDSEDGLLSAPVTITLDVLGVDITVDGRVTRESPAVGEGQTGRLLFAELEGSSGLRAGDFVQVQLEEPQVRGVARIPATALAANSTVLLLDDENRLSEAEVMLVRRQGDDVLVRARGLGGQSIVAERSPLLGIGIQVRPIAPVTGDEMEAPAMVALTPERRAALIAFIEASDRMPAEAKTRVLSQLEQDEVPAQVVERIESRMGS